MDLQTDGVEGTLVTFAGGSLQEAARVVFAAEVAGEWLVAVSYTHLDVYKRQALCVRTA